MFKYFAGPLIGALIGFCTNYIAVKMLFFPKKEIRLFGHRLPFTPGAIPKGKPRLAKAVGGIVGKSLITSDDIEAKLVSDEFLGKLSGFVDDKLNYSVEDIIGRNSDISEDAYIQKKDKLATVVSEQIADALAKADISGLIVEKGTAVITNKVQGTMLAMFVNESLIQSIAEPIGTEIQAIIEAEGAELIKPQVNEKLSELCGKPINQIASSVEISESEVKNLILSSYEKIVKSLIDKIMTEIDIEGIVEAKINEMSVDELEEIVLVVMKKELNMIVNLGALIGFILGLINLLF